MTRFVRFSCLALYMLTASLVLSACQVYSANSSSTNSVTTDDNAGGTAVNYLRLAPIAPPMPKAEYRPQLDDPRTQYWKPGYWSYDNGTFDWVPGEVVARPSPTAVWAPAYWMRHKYGWALVAGYWQ